MKKILIVGLGNPGIQYHETKHNVGFMTIDNLIKKLNIFLEKQKFEGIYTKTIIGDVEVFIAKPYTYMNLSGNFVRDIITFYKINVDDIIVIYDDIDTNIGKIKLRNKGSSGGQNGIKNIIHVLGTEQIKRIRIGIGRPTYDNLSSYVLSKFDSNQKSIIENSINNACLAILEFIKNPNDFAMLMNRFNR